MHRPLSLSKTVLIFALGVAGCAEHDGSLAHSATVEGREPNDAGAHDGRVALDPGTCPPEGAGEAEDEPNDRREQAQAIAPCALYVVRGAAEGEAAEHDWFEVRVPEGVSRLSVTVTAREGSGPELWILQEEASPIEHRALVPGERLVLGTGVEPGAYFIRARSGAGSVYELFVELTADPYELEATNDDPATAQPIALETTYGAHDSAFGGSPELDWFRIDVPEGPRSLTIEVEDTGEPDAIESELWIVREGALPIEQRAVRGGEAQAITIGVTVGEYFVRVRPGERRTYTLRATLGDEAVELEEQNDAAESAQPLVLGEVYEGCDSAAPAELDWDWFVVALPSDVPSLRVRLRDLGVGRDGAPGTLLDVYRGDALLERRAVAAGQTLELYSGATEGEYLFKVSVGGGASYTLSVEGAEVPFELEQSNDLRATAPVIEPGVTYTGQDSSLVTEPVDEDWFRIAVPDGVEALMVTVTDLESARDAGLDVIVFDAAGIQIGYVTADAGDTASGSFRVSEPGEHALLVRASGRRYRVVANL